MQSITRKLVFNAIFFISVLPVFAQEIPSGKTIELPSAARMTVAELELISFKNDELRSKMPGMMKIREEFSVKKTRNPRLSAKAQPTPLQRMILTNEPLQATQSIHSNFAGTHTYETNNVTITPPDCMGDLGPSQVCVASNNRIKWYNKPTVCETPLTTDTESGSLPLSGATVNLYLDDFFASVRNGSEVTDPRVRYDRLSQRWFISAINIASSSNRILIAVSNGPVITSAANFTFYQFAHDAGADPASPDAGEFCDYPTMGVDRDALYLGGLIFDANSAQYIGTSIYVVRKAALLTGSLVMTAFRQVGTSTTNIFCAQGVNNDDPAATHGFYVGVDAAEFGVLRYIAVANAATVPTISQFPLPVAATDFPNDVTTLGSTTPLDGSDDRIQAAMMMKNKLTGNSSVWFTHNISTNSAGSAAGATDRNAVRWYKLNATAGILTTDQTGTLFDPGGDSKNYWMGTIAASGQEHAVVGSTVAGPSHYANAAVAGRYFGTAPNALYTPINATNYSATYNLDPGSSQRWGDYSQTVVDPSDDMTLWTFQEFASGTDRWAVRAVQLKAPPPAPVANMSAITCTGSRIIDVTVNGTAGPGFAGYFDPGADVGGPGYQKRLAVSSSGSVTISNVVLTSPTQLNFSLNYAAAALGSQQTLTITNPDCQAVTFNYNLPTGCAVVPVTWLSISAAWNAAHGVVVWKVANESNLRHYEVEHSLNGNEFSSISIIEPKHAQQAAYTFTHLNAGIQNFYRVKQVDKDGKFSYSSVVSLDRSALATLTAWPNPAGRFVQIGLTSTGGELKMYGMDGKLVFSKLVQGNIERVNTSAWARGAYTVEYFPADGKPQRLRIVLR